MECSPIPYSRVPKSSALLVDYLYHFEKVSHFYSGSPFELSNYKTVAGQIGSTNADRSELSEILTQQNRAFGCGEATFENIRRLSKPGTFAVVTGQQVGLLSGPVFTLYKALTAVRLAQYLSDQGLPAVPVFWLATEDHDLEEVATATVLDDNYDLVELGDLGDRPAPRSSVGYVKLSEETNILLGRLGAALAAGEPRDRLLADLRATYQPGATWGHAFGSFMARLFSRWGVVLLDPLDEAVHHASSRVYVRALSEARELRRRLQERSQALVGAGYHAQVRIADDSTLLFTARDGNRLAVQQRDGEFLLDGEEKISLNELKMRTEKRPIELSANVLLRPLVQDTLLPTLAYIAGPSELAYLGQSQVLYSHFGWPMPVVFPRAGFTLLDRRVQRLMEKYHLDIEDVWKGEEHLSHKIVAGGSPEGGGWSERFEQTEQEIARLLDRLRMDIEVLDSTLVDSLKGAQEKMNYQMERLKGKLSRAALERSDLLGRHVRALLAFLTPRKTLQEREVSGVYFLGRAGYELLDRLLAQIQTSSSDHQLLTY
jgi:bacillithiol biosynthesis cysteine-adding enzyme BshC